MACNGMENLKPSKVYICVNILHNHMKASMVEKEMNEVFSISYNCDGSRYCCKWAKKKMESGGFPEKHIFRLENLTSNKLTRINLRT